MKYTQRGFSVLEALIIVSIVAALGFGGWYVWHAKQHPKTATTQSATSESVTNTKTAQPTATKSYTNDEYGFSFDYPDNWTLTTDLKMGRGHNEGDVVVTSPSGTKVHFGPNQAGKGGDCVDPEANDYTTRTCDTFKSYLVEKLPTSSSGQPIYYYQASLTAPTQNGGKTVYYIFISNNEYFESTPTSKLGAILYPYDEITIAKIGDVTVYVEGKDDAVNSSAAFFDTPEVQEATPILKSFKLL